MSRPKQSKTDEIIECITTQINNGELQPGQRIPSIAEIAAHHGVSTMPVRIAIERLKAAGIITGHQGKGLYVAEPPP